ncbi:ABC transporter permease [Parasphingorhabdus sp.]|uniref:ABC transporter permease n=1 Tax=Parasphingorhabdus sp. TaxID=2709688 RepID=UPI003BAFEA24
MTPLDRKLLRDLWQIKGQAVAIGAVIAVGVLMLVMMTGLVSSLDQTRETYYERYRLADVFAPVARAPERVMTSLSDLPGVASAEGRVTGAALVDLEGIDLPIQAKAVSLPDFGSPKLNDIYLTDGRKLDGNKPDEILLLKGFATAYNIKPGDNLRITIRGARRDFRVAGLAQSPEFLTITAPGELAPDDARFAVIWMNRNTAEAAYDMEGAFNEALLSLARGASEPAVLAAVDRVLAPYGGQNAYGLEDHVSNKFVTEEINGLRGMSTGVPPIFLAVAAFLLYIVISRLVQAEREQIGLMKAFGYTNNEVGLHYFKLVIIIAAGGALAGCLFGILAGNGMANLYLQYFKFPFLIFQLSPGSFIAGILISVLSASVGGLFVLRQVFALTPAVAMRAPAPDDYSKSANFGQAINRLLDQSSRMVVRRVTRQPGRMLGAMAGIAAGMALSGAMISVMSGFNATIDLAFGVIDRSDVTVSFTDPRSDKTILELQRMPGVIEVEPVRIVPAVLRNGLKTNRGAINGLVTNPRLNRAIDKDAKTIAMPQEGVVLATSLAAILEINPGDMLTVEVREGRQPILQIPVVGVTDSLLGSPAYMNIEALNRAMREPGRVSGAYLRIDSDRSDEIYTKLKNMRSVAGVSLKEDARVSFQKLMDGGAGAMRYVMAVIAFIITFGIVYNSARIAQAERQRDLASLRVIGFTKGEAAFVLLGEIAIVTLVALPLGALLGYFLTFGIAAGFSSDLYQIPGNYGRSDFGMAAVAVLAASLASGWLVKRDVDRTELISALKTKE